MINVKLNILSIVISSTIVISCLPNIFYSKQLKNSLLNDNNNKVPTTFNFYKGVFSNNDLHNGLNTKEYNWYFQPRNDNTPPAGPKETSQLMSKYDCYHLGDTSKKYYT